MDDLEVGYVGRDVESMVRDLVEQSGSHVLKEIKKEKGYVNVRFSFSKYNSIEEVDYVVNKIEEIRSF